ncbi:MAG TPA: hypothetical protein VEY12_05245 [Thermoplasmata archaeon]|nr:hypothetical protein [Thermoplasmata archaeon]
MQRSLMLAAVLPVAAIAIAAALILATTGSVGPPTTLPIPAGTQYGIALSLAGYMYEGWFTVRFTTSFVETLVGAWTSDGSVGTSIAWANGTNVPIFPIQNGTGAMGCSLTYDVTLSPGTYSMIIGAGHRMNVTAPLTVNWTVTRTIHLVPPVGNPAPVSRWAGQASPCP